MAMSKTSCKRDKSILYDSDLEKKSHYHNITNLSLKFSEDITNISRVYEAILERYKKNAKIKDFISVLVFKKVQRLIRLKNKYKKTL